MNPTVTVHFTATDEFTKELTENGPNVDCIIRVTKSFRPNKMTPSVRLVFVVAGYLRLTGDVLQLIELERFCGQHWGLNKNDEKDKEVLDRADKILTELEAAAAAAGCHVRAGTFEIPES